MTQPATELPSGAARVPDAVKALLEAGSDAAVVVDSERRILYYNRAYELASGSSGRALALAAEKGRRCYEVFPLDVCQTGCVGCRAAELGRPLRVEMVAATRGDGEALTLAVTAAALAADGGGTIIV